MSDDPWDALSDVFSAATPDDLPADAADNVLLAWPPILEFLESRKPARVLDFGCGGGCLIAELLRRGYEAVGVDRSSKMVESARRVVGNVAVVEVGDAESVSMLGRFNAIIAVMVLQFVEDVMESLTTLTDSLTDDGVIVFAVHHPLFVDRMIAEGRKPVYEMTPHGRRTTLVLSTAPPVQLYVRTVDEYDEMLKRCGFVRLLHSEPPFTQDFVDRYNVGDVNESEYLILGYERRV